jgi:hypothetical protein
MRSSELIGSETINLDDEDSKYVFGKTGPTKFFEKRFRESAKIPKVLSNRISNINSNMFKNINQSTKNDLHIEELY